MLCPSGTERGPIGRSHRQLLGPCALFRCLAVFFQVGLPPWSLGRFCGEFFGFCFVLFLQYIVEKRLCTIQWS